MVYSILLTMFFALFCICCLIFGNYAVKAVFLSSVVPSENINDTDDN